ncbi:hypothetical protein H8356DRAFT_941500 [Neocallimastix lanati (nom. inval.)]|nr:hypothetical protein H8356DRAFT_941500 [Neocallimastix sp. JGI-2020a]
MTKIYFHEEEKLLFKDDNPNSNYLNLVDEYMPFALKWINEFTREHAIEKVLKIKYLIGYSDYIINIENIYHHYKSFITKNDILSLLIRITSSKNKKLYDLFYNENYIESQISIFFFEQFSKIYDLIYFI